MDEQIKMSRRKLLRIGAAGAAFGAASHALPRPAYAEGPESVQVGEIYQLQADFHRAKTTQDLDLMMSLWADDAIFTNNSTGTTYVGSEELRSFWQGSGSFTHHRFSLVPSYKTVINVHGDRAFLYFRMSRRRRLRYRRFRRPFREDDRERHVPGRHPAACGRRLGLLEDDGRTQLAALLRHVLLPNPVGGSTDFNIVGRVAQKVVRDNRCCTVGLGRV